MKRTKKLIVLVMACVMLFGSTLTAHAACNWHFDGHLVTFYGNPCPSGHPYTYMYQCGLCGTYYAECSLCHQRF